MSGIMSLPISLKKSLLIPSTVSSLSAHATSIRKCSLCPEMIGPPVTGEPISSKVMLIGQAPGPHEGKAGKPFAWTAGKTLFKWFATIGMSEETFRQQIYMAAVCRCFPGKNPKGGDRVPSKIEIATCGQYLAREVAHLKPQLLLPVGKLAIAQTMPVKKLKDVVGSIHTIEYHGHTCDVAPLPHPSGASTWHRMEPGISLLQKALSQVAKHKAFRALTSKQ